MIKPNDVIAENVPKFYHDFSSEISPIMPIIDVVIKAALMPPNTLETKSV